MLITEIVEKILTKLKPNVLKLFLIIPSNITKIIIPILFSYYSHVVTYFVSRIDRET